MKNMVCSRAITIAWLSAPILNSMPVLPASAQAFGDLSRTPAAKFTPEDHQLLEAAAKRLLQLNDGSSQSWQNLKSGSSGKLELLKSFQATDGRSCKRLRVTNHAAGLDGVTTMNLCRSGEGKWLIDTEAKPA